MKKITFISTVTLLVLTACGGNKAAEEAARADSARQADSLAAVKLAAEQAEQARLDSIRQDSIDQAQKIIASIPSFKQVYNAWSNDALKSMFKTNGFEVSTVKGRGWDCDVDAEVPVDMLVASLNPGGTPSCNFKQKEAGWQMTINGAPEVLAKFAADAKAYIAKLKRENPDDAWTQNYSAVLKGNTVTLTMEGD